MPKLQTASPGKVLITPLTLRKNQGHEITRSEVFAMPHSGPAEATSHGLKSFSTNFPHSSLFGGKAPSAWNHDAHGRERNPRYQATAAVGTHTGTFVPENPGERTPQGWGGVFGRPRL